MTSLTERAQAAAAFIRTTAALSPYGPYRGEDHARTAVRLAAILGIGLDHITTAPDSLRRRTHPGEPVIATATCPDTAESHTFLARNPHYDDEPFELLGTCPECAGQVPLAEVRHLADFGAHLAQAPLTRATLEKPDALPDTFATDPGHTRACRFGDH
ncbi:hypothetical protein ABZ557_25865 [Streptomyces sp. NPDC019645]|uniref:hypothetical protein n=1 Tax=Streptomyces sp. NPDC019645 TaxID=3154786 RepID=UPI0033EA3256